MTFLTVDQFVFIIIIFLNNSFFENPPSPLPLKGLHLTLYSLPSGKGNTLNRRDRDLSRVLVSRDDGLDYFSKLEEDARVQTAYMAGD